MNPKIGLISVFVALIILNIVASSRIPDGSSGTIENLKSSLEETSDERPDESPDESPDKTPDKTPDETPDKTADKTPDETVDYTPDETPDGTAEYVETVEQSTVIGELQYKNYDNTQEFLDAVESKRMSELPNIIKPWDYPTERYRKSR